MRDTRLSRPCIPGLGEREKALRVCAIEPLDRAGQPASTAAGQIHQDADVFPIHHAQQTRRPADIRHGLRVFAAIAAAPRPAQVSVNVDDGKSRPLDARLAHAQHADGSIRVERHHGHAGPTSRRASRDEHASRGSVRAPRPGCRSAPCHAGYRAITSCTRRVKARASSYGRCHRFRPKMMPAAPDRMQRSTLPMA